MADVRAFFNTDVGYFDNPKVADLVEEHPRAVILHLRAIAYCAQHLTDGIFPMRLVMRLACASQCDLDMLAQCGLIHVLDDTQAEVHDYLEHQRSAEDAKRAKLAGQKAAAARWADKKPAKGNADRIPGRNADRNAKKEREKDPLVGAVAADTKNDRDDIKALCEHLSQRLSANNVKHSISKGWRDAARLLIDVDNRDTAEAHHLIDWATSDSFWRTNILSMPKFREKYDQLRLKAQEAPGNVRSLTAQRPSRPGSAKPRMSDYTEAEWLALPVEERARIAQRTTSGHLS